MNLDAATALAWLRAFAGLVDERAGELTDLDRPIGDSDHGVNLQRGMHAVVAAFEQEAPDTAGAVLTKAGSTLVSTVGGASGPLFGTLLRRTGKALDGGDLASALRAGLDGVVKLGGAQVGDATLVDALTPAVEALEAGRSPFEAAEAAAEGAASTEPLVARKGRASYLGERGVGHRDPGAESVVLLFTALEQVAA
ncbi:dihydroxyacetone kinase DhaL subunit [Kineococcus rhizosphaerae]|uniref:Dihydroxyacetone kinase DhaL subunit n=1 Tax=Kineococcus rhizosphaerae TaxID=559628 RepID=A0A2T0R7Z4_9ACTN|nr:dihydroxyacetone kinase subunit DhaL [Kineococcus rhizosphaerae]PRY17278.1 dihydroxyacetone kinase DhaL subunit [Kineococcus rhizosphaerae]